MKEPKGSTDKPSIESLLADLLSLFSVAGWTDHDLLDAISELSALRAENERLRLIETGAKDSEALVAHLRAENEALKKDLEECKSKRKAFIEEVKAKLLDRDTLLANWNEALEERDALASGASIGAPAPPSPPSRT